MDTQPIIPFPLVAQCFLALLIGVLALFAVLQVRKTWLAHRNERQLAAERWMQRGASTIRLDPMYREPPCEACADIRALLKSARGNQS